MKDAKYIIKRVIIGTLIALLVMFIKNNVFASSCDSSTTFTGYYRNNNTYTSWGSGSTSTIPSTSTVIRLDYSNSNIKNNHFLTSGEFQLRANGSFSDNPPINFYYGTGTNITTSCSYSYIREITGSADTFYQTTWNVRYACDYTGSSATGALFRVVITVTSYPITTFIKSSDSCIEILPSDSQTIINNSDQNTIDLMQDMYNYYISLWDKSNVSEQLILSEIDAQSEDIQDRLDDIESAIENLEVSYSEPSDQDLEDFNDDINDYFDNLGPDGTASTITDVLLDFVEDFYNAFTEQSCNSYSFPALFGYVLTLPCINLENYLGETVWEIVDYLFCFLFIFHWLKQLVHIIYNWLELKDGDPLG